MYNAPETGNKLPCMRSNSFRSIALAVHFVNVADQLTLYLGLLFFFRNVCETSVCFAARWIRPTSALRLAQHWFLSCTLFLLSLEIAGMHD